uniref:site-specific DNA-methyltransferase (adenine-specific) n=1 Tax=Candidatus Desulfatibia profunda TaxID=2841695 RepID=A0A8J6TGA2_9BACT|nr:site-specific DNA-methyltransferase [Candidatus Desulfatibia profunda]
MAQIQFKGKPFVQNHHLLVKYHELIPKKDKSLTDKVSLHDNLIIHGDNLIALKALLPLYAGKIKCIYIDPPYNTGNEKWAYNDNVNSPMMQEWLGKVVDREDLTRHDKWLCMMMPRLKLLRELLRDDGVIFISIDDEEAHHLRMLMDEIFGSENFIATIIWQKKYSPQNDAKYFSDMHDFILVYAKRKNEGAEKEGWQRNLLPRTTEQDARYKNPDNDKRGPWKAADFSVKTYSEAYDYEITTPSGRKVKPPKGRCWATSPENFREWGNDDRIWFGKTGNNIPAIKIFLSEVKEGIVPLTLWFREDVGDNELAKKEIKAIFVDKDSPFQTPKPASLLKRILQLSVDGDSIVLDSFAGSGSLAHAVLALNKEDGGNRKFILVECEDYADRITAERVRRIIKGVPNAKDGNLKKGLGGTFSYFELGKAIELESILSGDGLPTYEELARYIFYTATGEEFNPKAMNEKKNFVGESKNYEVYLFYEPDIEKLKNIALTLDRAESIGKPGKKKRLVFAPTKYLDQARLDELRIDFAQLPFEIYELAR